VQTGDAQVVDGGELDVGSRVSLLKVEYPEISTAEWIPSDEADSNESESEANQADLEDSTAAGGEGTESTELLLIAADCIEGGEWAKAHACLSELIRIDPENGTAFQQRVWARLELGMFVEAREDAEAAVRLEPDDIESYRARGAACIKVGQFEQAIVDLTRYVVEEDSKTSVGERPSRGYYLRGLAYAGLGVIQAAIKDYGRAIRRWPDWPEPYEARADAYEQIGKPKLAQADRDEAHRRAAP
jgi:tetratricopeptide (TPR) repeat protein